MPGTARKLIITERQQAVLQTRTRSRPCPQALARRARVILLAFEGLLNTGIADRIGRARHAVGPWRRRWAEAFDRLVVIACRDKESAPPRAIADLRGDLPRAGRPGKFTAAPVTAILAVACEPPENSNRPITRGTPRQRAGAVVKRGLGASISARQVGRFLKSGRPEAAPEPVWAQRPSGRSRDRSGAGPGRLRRLPSRPGEACEGHPHRACR